MDGLILLSTAIRLIVFFPVRHGNQSVLGKPRDTLDVAIRFVWKAIDRF